MVSLALHPTKNLYTLFTFYVCGSRKMLTQFSFGRGPKVSFLISLPVPPAPLPPWFIPLSNSTPPTWDSTHQLAWLLLSTQRCSLTEILNKTAEMGPKYRRSKHRVERHCGRIKARQAFERHCEWEIGVCLESRRLYLTEIETFSVRSTSVLTLAWKLRYFMDYRLLSFGNNYAKM